MPAFQMHHSKYRDAGKQAKTCNIVERSKDYERGRACRSSPNEVLSVSKQLLRGSQVRLNKDVGSGGLFTGYPRLGHCRACHWILNHGCSKKLIDIGFCGGFHRILKIILDGF